MARDGDEMALNVTQKLIRSHLLGGEMRPGAEVGPRAHVGNFVEIKAAVLGAGAKANHLSYIGDAAVGAGANIGAGTVTCNYDGVAKHRTEIGPGAFVGSDTALLAPVRLGARALVAAGWPD